MSPLKTYALGLLLVGLGSASKCPEPRKPHPTSCTIFYNCVNLPSGGYVWAPAKCSNGLVFQPYLRICVLPGDSWACDILSTDNPETTTNQIPELIDSTQTSYVGYNDGDTPRFSEPLDYYKIDNLQETVTPYPLIEVTQPNNYVSQIDSTIKNMGLPIAIKHSEDNYLYHFINGRQVLATPLNANGEQLQAHLQHLTELIERLVALQSIGIPLDRQPQTTASTMTTTNRLTTEYINNNNNLNKLSNVNGESAILNLLIKNYILKSKSENGNNLAELDRLRTTELRDQEPITTTTTTFATDNLDIVLNGPQAADNIVVVSDSLDNRQYFTINKYKSIANQLTTETVELIPCTSGVRMANSTDCTKYYSCDPDTAKIHQYSCPKNTAFNQYKRLCERNEFINCMTGINESTLKISPTSSSTGLKNRDFFSDDEVAESQPCQTIGKHGDPTSDTHYYLCYSEKGKSTDLKFQRMVCPNSLVFCQTKNVCTTRSRCEGI